MLVGVAQCTPARTACHHNDHGHGHPWAVNQRSTLSFFVVDFVLAALVLLLAPRGVLVRVVIATLIVQNVGHKNCNPAHTEVPVVRTSSAHTVAGWFVFVQIADRAGRPWATKLKGWC